MLRNSAVGDLSQTVSVLSIVQPRRLAAACLAAVCLLSAAIAAEGPAVPNFVDPGRFVPKPDLDKVRQIRFLTELDAPPFSYIGPDGDLTGFNVELARELCRVLDLPCTIQGLKWDLLVSAIDDKRGDAIIAPIAVTPASRERYDFTDRYLGRPARFVAREETDIADAHPETLAGRVVAVVADTAHEAFLRGLYPGTVARNYPDAGAALEALKKGEAEFYFGDGITLSLWLNGEASEKCCKFVGGPYTESRYFGEGMAIAVARNNEALEGALNQALAKVGGSNAFLEIYLRYFPISFY